MKIYNAEYYVYRHIRLDKNQPFYIGVGKTKNYQRAYSLYNRNSHWHSIVSNTDYIVEIMLDSLSFKEALSKEREFIELYGRSPFGSLCNKTSGGQGVCAPTAEVRKKISDSKIGEKNPMWGKKWTDEKRESMIKRMSGENNPNYGKPISENQKLVIAQSQIGRKKTDAEKNAIYSKIRKPVIDLNTGIKYDSINDLAKALNKPACTISRWLKDPEKQLKKL